MHTSILPFAAAAIAAAFAMGPQPARADDRLEVCASTSDLGNLAQEVGGDQVNVTVFVPQRGDAHFLEPRPGFVKALSKADLFVLVGLDLEVGWAPVIWTSARNDKVLPGAPGFVDCSRVIEPLQVAQGVVDRSLGDVHPYGNPHYLVDPMNGLRVAELLRDTLATTRPAKASYFKERFTSFHDRLGAALVGPELAKKYDFRKLAVLHERGKLADFLQKQGETGLLGGWIGNMMPYYGTKVVTDHNMWPYFARRFGLDVVAPMEPKPGIPPTTKHLGALVERMKSEGVKVVFAVPYYDPQYAQFLTEKTGAKVLPMAHLVGSREGTEDYIRMCDYNVKLLVDALAGGK